MAPKHKKKNKKRNPPRPPSSSSEPSPETPELRIHQEAQVEQKTESLNQEKVQNDDNGAKEKPETEENRADLHSNSSQSCLLLAHRERFVDDGANKREQRKTAEKLMYQNQQSLPDDTEPEFPHAASFSDRTPVPKNCKAKEPNKRAMTYEEKETLCKNLQDLILNSPSVKGKVEVPVQGRLECRHYAEEMKMASAVAEAPEETKLGPGLGGNMTVGDLKKKNKKDDQSRLLEAISVQQESGEVPEQFFNEVIQEMQKRMKSFQDAGEALKQLDTECVQSLLNVNAQLDEFAETASKFLPSASNLEDVSRDKDAS